LISFRREGPRVEVALHPAQDLAGVREPSGPRRKNTRMRRSILREFTGRSGDYNTGGSTRRSLVTAYRELSVRIACCLEKYGPLSPAQLRDLGTGDRTYRVLYQNVYGWFLRVGKGRYDLHEAGRKALRAYPQLRKRCRAQLRGRRVSRAPADKALA
jgi:hypothetical protein